jgi:hypothetical protein
VGFDGMSCLEEVFNRLPNYEKKFAHGRYMEDVAFRVKSKLLMEEELVNKHSATFLSFPYCELRNIDPSIEDHSPKHVPRTLLQTLYRSYSTKKLDVKPLSESIDFGDVTPVHVAQLWALTVKEIKLSTTPKRYS